jgi:hypothetical protein
MLVKEQLSKKGEERVFWTSERSCAMHLPYELQLQQSPAKIQNNPYYPRHQERCFGARRTGMEEVRRLVIIEIEE